MSNLVVSDEKILTAKVPFYSVLRDSWGWVRGCVKPAGKRCGECVCKKRCFVRGR